MPTTFARYTEQLVVLVDRDTRAAILRIARKEKRSKSDVIRELIEAGLAQRQDA